MSSDTACLDRSLFSSLEIAFAKKILCSIDQDNEEEAFALSFLMAASLEGHLCVKRKEHLFPKSSFLWERAFFETKNLQEKVLEEKILKGFEKLSIRKSAEESLFASIHFEGSRVYLQKNYVFETKIAHRMGQILHTEPRNIFLREKFFQMLQDIKNQGDLLEEQKEAIAKSFHLPLSLIVGGPGTGKTYTAAKMIQIFAASFDSSKKKIFRVAIVAPTGRAADHLKNAILKRADVTDTTQYVFSTLHALLKIKEGYEAPFLQRPQMADLIIVDEASMIDPRLMSLLFEAAAPSSRLVLMGDAHQLSAVEGGSIFSDMAQKKSFHGQCFTTFLQRSIRFENEHIVHFSKMILEGNIQEAMKEKEGIHVFYLEEEKKLQERFFYEGSGFFSTPFMGTVDVRQCFEYLQHSRLLCPLRNGFLGVEEINQKFLKEMMKRATFGEAMAIPIVILRNDAEKKLSNGTLGIISFVFRGEKKPFLPSDLVYFWNEEEKDLFTLPLCSLPLFEAAFCLSVHKSQGSEFSHVVLLLPPGSERFGKEMLYTAVTRAKKDLIMIGREKTITELFQRRSVKSSGLLEKLEEEERS